MLEGIVMMYILLFYLISLHHGPLQKSTLENLDMKELELDMKVTKGKRNYDKVNS